MNQRIQELKDKIWTEEYWTNPNTDKLLPTQLNRFAELIVRECMEQLNISNVPAPISAGLNLGRVAIKEHFGVEE